MIWIAATSLLYLWYSEPELYAEAAAIQEVLWLRGVLKELGLSTHTGSVVHGDNQSAIAVSKNGIKGERTKHVDIKYATQAELCPATVCVTSELRRAVEERTRE